MHRVVKKLKGKDADALIRRVQEVGQRLTAAQPRELAVGNIVRRVLGVIREEAEEDNDIDGSTLGDGSGPGTPKGRVRGFSSPPQHSLEASTISYTSSTSTDTDHFQRPPLLGSHTSYAVLNAAPMVTSMFSLLSHPLSSNTSTPGSSSPALRGSPRPSSHTTLSTSFASSGGSKDLSIEVADGIVEIIDELSIVDDQIAAYAPEHIHSNEMILTYGSSQTVQKFLLRAAAKRKFTVIHAEGFPNMHRETHALVTGKHSLSQSDGTEDEAPSAEHFSRPLIAAGITVVLIPDAAVFALLSRVNKVILGTHIVLANGGLIAAAGSKAICMGAREHRTPVVVVTGVYKLCPNFSFDFDALIEHGSPGPILGYGEDGDLVDTVDVENPLHDFVPANLIDLYVTNLGGHAPFSLSGVISDQYRAEDTDLAIME